LMKAMLTTVQEKNLLLEEKLSQMGQDINTQGNSIKEILKLAEYHFEQAKISEQRMMTTLANIENKQNPPPIQSQSQSQQQVNNQSIIHSSNVIEGGSKLLTDNHLAMIKTWISSYSTAPFKMKLLYQGTRDGFTRESFGSKCYNLTPIMIFIKAQSSGNIFGGFQTKPRNGKEIGLYKGDDNAFLFSVTFGEKYPIKAKEKAFYELSKRLFDFGGAGDISIAMNCHTNEESYTQFPYYYSCSKFNNWETGKTYLAGTYNFRVEEIEVFHLIFS